MNKEEIFNKLNIKVEKIEKKGKITIVNNKYVYKKQLRKADFYDYLLGRGFNNFPKVYTSTIDEIELYDYVEEKEVPIEQKIEDLVYLISILHTKTIFDKQIDIDYIKKIYEEQIYKQNEYLDYYQKIQDQIEEEKYISPDNYYLIRNISIIYKSIVESRKYLDKWYEIEKEEKTIRFAYTHGNLKQEHIIENNNLYLISWDNSIVNYFIYDIENIYKNNFMYITITDLLKIYENKIPLKKEEKYFLLSLILMPEKIDDKLKDYSRMYKLTRMIMLLEKTLNTLESNSKESNNNTNK